MISFLLSSQAVDFVITGCSSGQGMALACNALPNVICGFVQNPQDAFLFGRINDGNAVSFSLGLGYGWLGELNLEYSIEKLFDGEFGIGYPAEVAKRKIKETKRVQLFNAVAKKSVVDLLTALDKTFLNKVLSKNDLIDYIFENGQDQALNKELKQLRSGE